MVEVEDADDAREEDELDRCRFFRGTNMRLASVSVLMLLKFTASPAVHPLLLGCATIQVIGEEKIVSRVGSAVL